MSFASFHNFQIKSTFEARGWQGTTTKGKDEGNVAVDGTAWKTRAGANPGEQGRSKFWFVFMFMFVCFFSGGETW
jgi:hypothetical protein